MANYEAAPATELVATTCACCGKDLLDAESVETGVGPTCRKAHGYGKASGPADWDAVKAMIGEAEFAALFAKADLGMGLDDTARRMANLLVHRIAALAPGAPIKRRIVAVGMLGFDKLATRIADRFGSVHVDEEDGRLVVRAPKRAEFMTACSRIPGSRWDGRRHVRTFPVAAKVDVWKAIKRSYPGFVIVGRRLAVA